MRFSIEKLRYPQDLEKLYSFFARVYSSTHILLNRKFFKWQFIDQRFTNLVLKNDTAIVGHAGLIGKDFVFQGRKITASFLSCLIVAEHLRGKGGGAYLSREAEKGMDCLYATGINNDGMTAFNVLGWQSPGNLYRWVYRTLTTRHESRAKEEDEFDETWNVSWKNMQTRFGLTLDRTSDHLNWRFAHHPLIKYKTFCLKDGNIYKGYLVARLEEGNENRAVRIVDLIAEDKSAESELIKMALSYASELKVDFIDFFCSSGIYGNSFTELGFSGPESAGAQEAPIFILPLDTQRKSINWAYKIINHDLKDIKKEDWFIVKADGDKDRPQ